MRAPETEEDLLGLIQSGTGESLTLEYKGARALSRKDRDKDEITKDVSSFANSAGGTLIYGIAEGDAIDTRHLPVALSPIDRTDFSREWLDQVCARIQPKIEGLTILPIKLGSGKNHVAYVVSIPQSETAHQAADKRYYKRSNFASTPMEDYEIRDVMNRLTHPIIEIEAEIACSMTSRGVMVDILSTDGDRMRPDHEIRFQAFNRGKAIAHHIVCAVNFAPESLGLGESHEEGTIHFSNHVPQFTGQLDGLGGARYGNPQWIPILPGLGSSLHTVRLCEDLHLRDETSFAVAWVAFCDTAPPRSGSLRFSDIKHSFTEDYRQFVARDEGR